MPVPISTSIVPWLSVQHQLNAADFYKAAFAATEVYRMEDPGGGIVGRLSVEGAEFWVSQEFTTTTHSAVDRTVRMILTIADPDAFFARALKAGATEIFPVGESHGWRLGRLADPFGFHWEIGHQL